MKRRRPAPPRRLRELVAHLLALHPELPESQVVAAVHIAHKHFYGRLPVERATGLRARRDWKIG